MNGKILNFIVLENKSILWNKTNIHPFTTSKYVIVMTPEGNYGQFPLICNKWPNFVAPNYYVEQLVKRKKRHHFRCVERELYRMESG